MTPYSLKITRRLRSISSVIALLCLITLSARGAFSGTGVNELFTDEEKMVRAALQDEFAKMGPRAYILRGTLLYLYNPHKSKYYNVNSLGFRGEEVKPKKKNGFNIMVMGGSTIFGDSQADFQTIPAVLKDLLQKRHPDREIQVYNLGIEGYVFQREIALAMRLRKKIDPDLVVFYHGCNDFFCAYRDGYVRFQPFNEEEETFFVKKQKEGWLTAVIGMAGNAFVRARAVKNLRSAPPSEKAASVARGYLQDVRYVAKFFHSGGFFQKKNVPVLFVVQPTVFTRKNRTPREQKIADNSKRPNYEEYVKQCVAEIVRAARSEGIAIHDFTGAFDEYEGEIFRDEMHVNAAGNKIIAEKLANLIEDGRHLAAGKAKGRP